MRIVSLVFGVLLLGTVVAAAGPPQIENSGIESRILQGSLSSAVEVWSESIRKPSWLAWQVPMVQGDQVLCCWSRGDRRWQSRACTLEGPRRHFVFSSGRPRVLMESENLVVLLKADNEQLDEMRVFSDGCRLDAGGREVIWLEGVEPEESAALLGRLAESASALEDEALMAMALHATPVAANRLAGIARQSPDPDLRGEALFWLSHTGATKASDIILEALAEDPDTDVREDAIFALSLLPDHEGMPLLLEIIQDRSRPSPVREEAFFWYVQSGDDQALDLIAEILHN